MRVITLSYKLILLYKLYINITSILHMCSLQEFAGLTEICHKLHTHKGRPIILF